MSTTTATMQQYGTPSSPDGARHGGTSAGLVLLYSANFEKLPAAYPMTAHQAYIGRDPSCAICLPEQAVSRRHALIEYAGDRWVLRDLGGPNGTMVDGQFVDQVELEPQHEVRVGDSVFKFVESGAEYFAPYRIDGVMLAGAARRATLLTELVGGLQIDKIGAQLERIAPVELSVIIQGESGTGKEVVAREIHRLSQRRGPLQAVNCAAIPGNLIESELFGYKRGAFSGADRDKLGLIAAAHNGTLLLDEIGDMPLDAQAKLLRVLQSREVYPVGATAGQKVDVRVICATNRDLSRLVREERFRGDLLARLNEFYISLPPLRDRKEDIYLLSHSLLARHGARQTASFQFMLALLHYDWPYNVRELEGCLKRAAALSDSNVLDTKHLPEIMREAMAAYGSRKARGQLEPPEQQQGAQPPAAAPPGPEHPRRSAPPTEEQLRELLARHRGNVAAVGRELGKERMQIHRWMQRYGIVVDEYRS
jgi:DNA-binding NtrC family response regulator